jgi:hypothetical protein
MGAINKGEEDSVMRLTCKNVNQVSAVAVGPGAGQNPKFFQAWRENSLQRSLEEC